MPDYRKKVRSQIVTALAHATTGFNAQLTALAGGGAYDCLPFALNFTFPSRNFLMGYLVGDTEIEVSDIIEFPGATLHTANAVDLKKVKFRKFSGQVITVLNFWLRYRALTDIQHAGNEIDQEAASFNYEEIADAVEDAALEALAASRPVFQQNGVALADYQTDRSPIQLFGDGYLQQLTITLGCEVNVG